MDFELLGLHVLESLSLCESNVNGSEDGVLLSLDVRLDGNSGTSWLLLCGVPWLGDLLKNLFHRLALGFKFGLSALGKVVGSFSSADLSFGLSLLVSVGHSQILELVLSLLELFDAAEVVSLLSEEGGFSNHGDGKSLDGRRR